MELRQLEYFLTVSDLKSFTKAARASFVSQPAITNAINSLENELGIKLFDRTNRKVSLTTEGEIFYNHVGMVMRDIESARTHMNNLKRQRYGIIKIAVNSLITTSYFIPAYNKFLMENPCTKITFSSSGHEQVKKLIDEDDFDIAIVLGSKEEFKNSCAKLIVPGKLSLFKNINQNLDIDNYSFKNKPVTMIKGNYYFNKMANDYFDNIDIICKSDSLDIIQYMLTNNQSLALLPDFIKFQDENIQKVPITTEIDCGIYLIWRDGLTQLTGKKFVDFFYEYYRGYNMGVE